MQMPAKIQELFQIHFQDNGRDFVLLIQYAAENGFTDKDIIRSYEALRLRGVHKVSADQIKAFMHANNEPQDGNGENVPAPEHRQQSRQIEDAAMGILVDDQDDGQHTGFNSNRFFKLKKYCYGLLVRKEMITDYARELKINVLQNELEDFITLATQENWGCRTLIARILEKEMEIRVEKRRKQRVRIAGFPQMKYLQELIREDLPKDAQMVIRTGNT